ncbi:hypothetical protein EZ428_10985 [Pedobacter frigiditerrae]|uniref:Uncharacterized protein n=1 Tax=Pedobacter frigiditerrae TaxID=2530452 RepID=A0A4R0MZ80_9SPHI|nr:hypothetical protein [Pedobacter frigiditerrae]TCC92243.1 hypothetical protein EZ428_10985 [Pedobacter frigiditerrae]
MNNRRVCSISVILVLFLTISVTKVFAAQGCLIGSTIYTTFVQNVYGGFFGNRPQYASPVLPALYGACPALDQNRYALREQYHIGYPFAITNCGLTTSYNSNNIGVLYNYTEIKCPIDDYIPFLILSVGGLGFFYLRRTNKLFPVIR